MCYLANEVTMEEIFMVFAVLFGLLIVSFVFFAVAKNKRDADNNSKPIQSVKPGLLISNNCHRIRFCPYRRCGCFLNLKMEIEYS